MVAANNWHRHDDAYEGREQTLLISHKRNVLQTYADAVRSAYADYFLDMYEHGNPFDASLSVFGEALSDEDL